MTPATRLLERLEGVRATSEGQWLARCPAHADRSSSLSIREKGDSTLLVHCHAACDTGDVLAAIGLELGDLFVRPIEHHQGRRTPPRHDYRGLLRLLRREAVVVALAAHDIGEGRKLSDVDVKRLAEARVRIVHVAELAT